LNSVGRTLRGIYLDEVLDRNAQLKIGKLWLFRLGMEYLPPLKIVLESISSGC
jgi:hypothetical protein